jgi:hypothetical protein
MSNAASVERLFFVALEKEAAAERAAYLDAACAGDAELRRQVEKLLKAHPRVGDFLKKPVLEQLAAAAEPSGATEEFDASTDGPRAVPANRLDFLQPSTTPGSLGRIGHYEALELLGRGGFGIVFRAFDKALQRVVAIKVLAPQLAVSSPPRKRFLREARSSARVRHENVVQVHAVEEQPLPYLVMEFIPGETLQQRLDRTGPLEVTEVLQIGRQIALGLAAAHGTGLIHRDVKPANILLEGGPQPRVKITDFGLARAADDASLTQSGILAGTPMFMAPEQASGETLDHRADLFSLGSVLYTMCTGRPPFRAKGMLAVLKRVAEDTPRPIREIIPEVPQWLCAIIAQLHAKNPDDRFASAQEVAEVLTQHLDQVQPRGNVQPPRLPAPAGEIPEAVPTVRQPRPRARRWEAAAVVLLTLVGGLGFTEATGVTDLRGTVIRLFSPQGTLVVEVDDPTISVKIDGPEIVITGAGVKEIRLKPGSYTVEASKDGKVVSRELVAVTKDGRRVVRVSHEAAPAPAKAANAAWERSVAAMPANEQLKAVIARLKELNPGFDGRVQPTVENGALRGLAFETAHVSDIAPLRACTRLRSINCCGDNSDFHNQGLLIDLSPLRGLPLTNVRIITSPVFDLSPLAGMALTHLNVERTLVSDLTPLKGMPLRVLNLFLTPAADLTPLKGMPLQYLQLMGTKVTDLSPLKGMPLEELLCAHLRVPDFAPLKGMPLRVLWGNCPLVCDLSPLKGMPLVQLGIDGTQVSDLSPLAGMPLEHLGIDGTRVTDLSVLKGLPLKSLRCDFKAERDAAILRAIKTLETINDKPVAQFWKDLETK